MHNSYQADIVFCLASAQAIPNVIPPLQNPPEIWVVMHTHKFKQHAEDMKHVIGGKNIQVVLQPLGDKTAEYYNDAWENTAEIYERYKNNYAGKTFALNMTGGTKILSTAATDAFKDMFGDAPVYYVGLDTQKIHMLSKDTDPLPIQHDISLVDYLRVYGYGILSKNDGGHINPKLKQSRHRWVQDRKLVTSINALAAGYDPYPCPKHQLTDLGLFDGHTFTSDENKKYAGGGWLEQYVFENLNCNRKKLGITDIYWGVEINNIKTDTPNELDIAFIKNNTLYIIECKTNKPYDKQGKKKPGQESDKTLYKISAIQQNLRAVASKSAIATIYPLDAPKRNDKPHTERAKDLHIKVFEGDDLYPQNVVRNIKTWLG